MKLIKQLSLSCGLIISSTCLAETPLETLEQVEKDPTHWYQIEIIAFAQLDSDALSEEVWPVIEQLPEFKKAIPILAAPEPEPKFPDIHNTFERTELSNSGVDSEILLELNLLQEQQQTTEQPATLSEEELLFEEEFFAEELIETEPEDTQPLVTPYQLLPEQDWILKTELDNIKANDRYQIIYHGSWLQPFIREGKSTEIYINSNSEQDQTEQAHQLAGNIKLQLGYYLTFEPNLYYKRSLSWLEKYNLLLPENKELSEQITNQNQLIIQLNSARKMRSHQIYYIDHPLVGLLISIKPFKLPEPEPKKEDILKMEDTTASEVTQPTAANESNHFNF